MTHYRDRREAGEFTPEEEPVSDTTPDPETPEPPTEPGPEPTDDEDGDTE